MPVRTIIPLVMAFVVGFSALIPNTKDIKRELLVEGVTANKIAQWIDSGKTLNELAGEYPQDSREGEFLKSVMEKGASLPMVLESTTRAFIEDFSRYLARPGLC